MNVFGKIGMQRRYGRSTRIRVTILPWPLLLVMLIHGSIYGQPVPKSGGSQESAPEFSGMYSFLQEGEFLQLTIEEQGQVTGFISRYSDSEHRGFSDHFFKRARLDGKNLLFSTEMVQNVSYEFKGTIGRNKGKKPGDEGYYTLKGMLTQSVADSTHPTVVTSQAVVFKSFPDEDAGNK